MGVLPTSPQGGWGPVAPSPATEPALLLHRCCCFTSFSVSAQIYNEAIRDLLNPSSGLLDPREDARGSIQIAGVMEVSTSNAQEVRVQRPHSPEVPRPFAFELTADPRVVPQRSDGTPAPRPPPGLRGADITPAGLESPQRSQQPQSLRGGLPRTLFPTPSVLLLCRGQARASCGRLCSPVFPLPPGFPQPVTPTLPWGGPAQRPYRASVAPGLLSPSGQCCSRAGGLRPAGLGAPLSAFTPAGRAHTGCSAEAPGLDLHRSLRFGELPLARWGGDG